MSSHVPPPMDGEFGDGEPAADPTESLSADLSACVRPSTYAAARREAAERELTLGAYVRRCLPVCPPEDDYPGDTVTVYPQIDDERLAIVNRYCLEHDLTQEELLTDLLRGAIDRARPELEDDRSRNDRAEKWVGDHRVRDL